MITIKKKFSDSYNFVYNKIVLLRVDLNIPFENNQVLDSTRIKKILPTINNLLKHKAKIIIISHLGRPKGKWLDDFSLKVVISELENLTNKSVLFFKNNIKNIKKDEINEKFQDHDIIVFENIRFYPEEEKNDQKFTKKIASLGDIYINECFSCSHRNHSSISGIPEFLPSFPGELLENEIQNLKNLFLLSNHQDSVAVLGGAKISTKIKLIEFYASKFSKVLIGGAMANTILVSQGFEIGASLIEKKMIKFSNEVFKMFKDKILLPTDVIVSDKKLLKKAEVKLTTEINKTDVILDIGPKTRMLFFNEVVKAKTILWNGPLGFFEKKPFDEGTHYVLKSIKANKNKNFFSVAGGGDTISILNQSNCFNDFSFVSTGGGAFLEFIQGENMPGLSSLNE